jgi:Fic family protein
MRIPKAPPDFNKLLRMASAKALLPNFAKPELVNFVNSVNDKYLPWDEFRHRPMPLELDPELGWIAVAVPRFWQFRALPISFYDQSDVLKFWTPPQHHEWLHRIDQQAGGTLGTTSRFAVQANDERYLWNSLMEEAIASSQLEGASTTREVAKTMLRRRRKPKDKSERMILNNYRAIQYIRELRDENLTPKLLCKIQEIITHETLDGSGRFRKPGDTDIVVEDTATREVLHRPPPHDQVEWRIAQLCEFANTSHKPFIHPVIKASILHFAIGFIHPFADGNGRAARAVFYWYMLKHGYWLFEYLPLSRIFLRAPAKYSRAYLYAETDGGDVTYFTHYLLRAVCRALTELHEYLDKQQHDLHDAARLLRENPELNHRQLALLYDAIRNQSQIYTIAQHAGLHHVVLATARKDLLGLTRLGFLSKARRGREWIFVPDARVVERIRKKLTKTS